MGSDARGVLSGLRPGARAVLMLLHKAENGQTSLTSLPRHLRGHSRARGEQDQRRLLVAAPRKLLVQTVEALGLTVDHYVEVGGMTGPRWSTPSAGSASAGLRRRRWTPGWSGTSRGVSDGGRDEGTGLLPDAVDPTGDVGRGRRQPSLRSGLKARAVTAAAGRGDAGTNTLTVDRSAGAMSIAQMVLAFAPPPMAA